MILSYPVGFTRQKYAAMAEACRLTGLNMLNLINEPIACALNYEDGKPRQEKTVLVYDLGGTSFDAVMVRISADGDAKVLRCGGYDWLGGKDWDYRLSDFILERFQEEYFDIFLEDAEGEARRQIQSGAEALKCCLSSAETATLSLRVKGEDAQITMTRQEFEGITENLVKNTPWAMWKMLCFFWATPVSNLSCWQAVAVICP